MSLLLSSLWPASGPTVTQRPAVTGPTRDKDRHRGPTTKDGNVSVSTNSSESSGSSGSGILGGKAWNCVGLPLVECLGELH